MTPPSPDASSGPRARLRDPLADFSADRRLLVLSALAAAIGAVGATVAWALVALIRLITGLAYHGAIGIAETSPADHRLGAAAALVPVAGGLAIGVLARYGSEKIRGDGIPEASRAPGRGHSSAWPR
jgi:chloride channel protein, CIC family